MFRIKLNTKVKERIRQHRYTSSEMDTLYLELLRQQKQMLLGWRRAILMVLMAFLIVLGSYIMAVLHPSAGTPAPVDNALMVKIFIFMLGICLALILYIKLFWVDSWRNEFIKVAKEYYWDQPGVWEKSSWSRAAMRQVNIKDRPKLPRERREQVLESLPYSNSGPIERGK